MGLFAYVAALPDGSSTTLETLAKLKSEGKEAIMKARRELEDAGFLRVVEDRHQGRFASSTWMLAIKPHDFDELLPGADGEIQDPPPVPKAPKASASKGGTPGTVPPQEVLPLTASPATDSPSTVSPETALPSPVESPHIKNIPIKTDLQKTEEETPKPSAIPPDVLELVEAWNAFAAQHEADGIAPIIRLSKGKRLQAMRTRLQDPWWKEHFAEALAIIPMQRWRMGLNDRNWKADMEWFCRPDTVDKLIEEGKVRTTAPAVDSRNLSCVRPEDLARR